MHSPTKRRNKTPKNVQVYDHIVHQIQNGVYKTGEFLPPLRAFCREFGSSMTPIVQAIRRLEAEDFVEVSQGLGVKVKPLAVTDQGLVRKHAIEIIGLRGVENQSNQHANHTAPALQRALFATLAQENDLRLTLSTMSSSKDDHQAFEAGLADALTSRPDALIVPFELARLSDAHYSTLLQIKRSGTAVIYHLTHRELVEMDCVRSDFAMGQRLLTEYLLERGHREIIRFGYMEAFYEKQKQDGFRAALNAAGFPDGAADRSTYDFSGESGIGEQPNQQIERYIGILTREFALRPLTAVMAHTDYHVAAIRCALNFMNRSDVDVVGYDAIWQDCIKHITHLYGEAATAGKSPASVDCKLIERGEALAKLTLERLRGRLPEEPQTVDVPQALLLPA
ncbi:MAG: GntR family transcriptional regulator [Verrucomicrobiota bacterium]